MVNSKMVIFIIFAAETNATSFMISRTYYRYIWLLNTLLQKEMSYDEIVRLWQANPMFKEALPLRTFHEHRKGIKEMFGVDIECNKSRGYVYYVKNPEVLKSNTLVKWLLRNYSVPSDFATFNYMKDRILLEEIPGGMRHIDCVIDALQKNVELELDYQKYGGQNVSYHIQPYALKVYHRRWYLLGYIKELEAIRTLALDRMIMTSITNTRFELPADFDARKYFANSVGVFVNEELPIVQVIIRAYGVQAEYLRSLPLHKSQKEGRSKHGEFAEFTYRLCVTPDLISQLLAMGDKVEVLEPQTIRDEIKERLEKCLTRYNKE